MFLGGTSSAQDCCVEGQLRARVSDFQNWEWWGRVTILGRGSHGWAPTLGFSSQLARLLPKSASQPDSIPRVDMQG